VSHEFDDHPDATSSELADLTNQLYAARNTRPAARGRRVTLAAAVVVVLAVLAGAALVGAPRFLPHDPAPIVTGTLAVTTNPAGAEAIIDGVKRGTTPLTLKLPVGSHKVELRGQGEPRIIPVTITPGAQVTQYVDLPMTASPGPAHVEILPYGVTPPPPPATTDAAPLPGWIAMGGKLDVQMYEAGRLIGSSRIDRIMIPAGRHDLELVNDLIGYRGTRTIQVAPGKVSTVTIDPPKTTIAINAMPWAEVWIDGERAGDTPIGNFAVTAGSHDIVFRHPDLGELRETVLVTLKTPVRLSVDMRKP